MSYITSTLKCDDCGREMNVAFGIVGMTQIAGHPKACPDCGCESLTKIADGWHAVSEAGPMSDDAPATTGDPQVDEQLASLEKGQHGLHRMVRRTLLINGIGLGGLLLGDLALVLLGGGRWVWRDVAMVSGLAGMGATALYSAKTLLERVIRLDAEVVEELRARARMAAIVDASRPLIEAMREAARTGLPITVVAQHLSAPDDDEPPTRH